MPKLLDELILLLNHSLGKVPQELNELDWKEGLSDNKERLKEHLSAFANYPGGGFLVFGIKDEDASLTDVTPDFVKHISQKLGNLSSEALDQRVQIDLIPFSFRDKHLFAIYINESSDKPVHIRGKSIENSYTRSGGQTRMMSKQDLRQAIASSRSLRFEELPASIRGISDAVDELLDVSKLMGRMGASNFSSTEARDERLIDLKILTSTGLGLMPTNLGVMLCAKDFSKLSTFERYAVRVLVFEGTTRLVSSKEKIFNQGYTLSLDLIVAYVLENIPHSEVIKQATRLDVPAIPEIAIRELVGNAVIHRDYTRTDSYTSIEIFTNRIEIQNPGGLFGDLTVDRLLDHPPRARNEVFADSMKLLNFYEERGSGIDKTVNALELHCLPPVDFRSTKDHFATVLHFPRSFDSMTREERINAVYQHTCLNFVCDRKTTNTTVRQRFDFDDSQKTKVLRLLTMACDAGRIKVADPSASPKAYHYVPYWA